MQRYRNQFRLSAEKINQFRLSAEIRKSIKLSAELRKSIQTKCINKEINLDLMQR